MLSCLHFCALNNLLNLYFYLVHRDKKIFYPSGKPCRQRTLFSRLKQKTYDKSADTRLTMTLPPETYGNRKDSIHVSAARGVVTDKDSFAWASAHNRSFREDDDRLSTISSKDDSRDSDHFGPFKLKREDSQCQTGDELLQSLLQSPKLRRRAKPMCLRGEPDDKGCSPSTSELSYTRKESVSGDEFDNIMRNIQSPNHKSIDDDFDESIEEIDELSQILKYDGPSIVTHTIGNSRPHQSDRISYSRSKHKGPNVTFESVPTEFENLSCSDTDNSVNNSPRISNTYDNRDSDCHEKLDNCHPAFYGCSRPSSHQNDSYSAATQYCRQNSDADTGKRKSIESDSNSNCSRIKCNEKQICLLAPKHQTNPDRIECKHPKQLYSCTTNNDLLLNQFSIKNPPIHDNQTDDHRAFSISMDNSGDNSGHSGSSSESLNVSNPKDSPIDLEALDDEEVSMVTFQNYLRDHGVGLDISAVQSSDV